MKTKHTFLHRDLEAILAQNVLAWEEKNTPLRAIVQGCYVPSELTSANENKVFLNRLPETIDDFGRILELYGFCLIADSNQISDESWAQLGVLGQVFDTAEEYLLFVNSLILPQ